MAISLKHAFQSAVADSGDTTLVQPSNWNAEHTLTLATGSIIGRTTAGTGAAEEISIGTGLSLAAGSLSVASNVALTGITNTFTASQTVPFLTIGSGTITSSTPAIDASQTWNNAAVQFTGIRLNVTDTASTSNSYFINLQVGGADRFNITKAGTVSMSGNMTVNGGTLTNAATGTVQWSGRGILTSPAAGGVQFGAADAAAPVAQTVSAQSVVAGTSNTAGADFTIRGSRGTGTGAGGSVIIQTAPAGTTGTAQNAAVERFRVGPAGQLGIGGANYGTSGQALLSGGASAAPAWTDAYIVTPTVTTYTSGSGNWTIPAAGTFVLVRAWGGGGSGGRGGGTATQGAGGGGGSFTERLYLMSSLGTAGSTVAYSIGAGGAALAVAGNGNPGGNTTFSTGSNLLTAYGGGGGGGNGNNATGGGGGGVLGAGASGTGSSAGGTPGDLGGGTGADNATTRIPTVPNGGGGGAGTRSSTSPGGSAFLGGAGGGSANGAATISPGTSVAGGNGGAASTSAGTPGTSGSAPSGGGGGQSANGGSSGAGGSGRIEIWVW